MKPLLEVRHLTVRYGSGRGSLTAVDDVTVSVPKGATLGLVGESGCGKSTLARALVGLVPIVSGQLRLAGVDRTSARSRDVRAYRRRVQMVFQDPYSSLNPRMTVGEALDEALSVREEKMSSAARRIEAGRVLQLVGLTVGAHDRYPHQFSGGQRQRIAIARALAVGPDLIIADEVTSALDVSVQATILNLLKDLQSRFGLSYLFVSHDLSVARYMSDEVAVMYLGKIVEQASSHVLFEQPLHPYTRGLISAVPRLAGSRSRASVMGDVPDPRMPPPGCRFHTRCPIGPRVRPERTICVEEDPQQVATRYSHFSACHFALDQSTDTVVVAGQEISAGIDRGDGHVGDGSRPM